MPEALTESFCERCGTRYEFEAPTRLTGMRKTRGLVAGLRHYIMSQDSLTDAVGDAIRSEEERIAAGQLDAFHESFKFCMDCRQYTCVSCWNEPAGRCRSCAPLPGVDDLIERMEATAAPAVLDDAILTADAWPTGDLGSGEEPETQPPEPAMAPESPAPEVTPYAAPHPEPVTAAETEPVPEPEPIAAEADVEPVLAEIEPEPTPMAAEPEPEPTPMAAESEPEPTPTAAESEPEPTPAAAEAEPEAAEPFSRELGPIGDTILRLPRPDRSTEPAAEPVAAEADEAALAARRAQLELLGLGDPGQGPVSEQPTVLPYRSRGAAAHPVELAAAARLTPIGSVWDASAREVAGAMSQIGIRNCGRCELSLSASARFCRRCGSPQTRSA